MGKITDKESLIRTLQESLGSGDVEKVKRVADALYEVGGDPVAILTSALNGQPDAPDRHAALQALESLDSSALRKIEGPPAPTASQEPEEPRSQLPKVTETDQVFHLSVSQNTQGPFSAKEIESLLLDQTITVDSMSVGPDSEWRPLREQPYLQKSITASINKLHGPQQSIRRTSILTVAVSCLVSQHNFTDWRYTSETSCEVSWHCRHCSKTKPGETRHVYGATTFLDDGHCQIGKRCIRCTHALPEGIQHTWGEWSSSCNTTRQCTKCGATEAGEIKHSFGTPRKMNECTYIQNCTRCNEYAFSSYHSWGAWEYESPSSCRRVRPCKHCDSKDYGSTEHKWGAYQYESPTSCKQVRFCRRCHEEDYGFTEHKWIYIRNPSSGDIDHICAHCGEI